MPKKIRKVNQLQTLTNFVVGEPGGSDIEELESLNLVQGKLCLSGLNNVTDPTHAIKVCLHDKKLLEKIRMTFDGSLVESNVSVLDALQPNNNLKRLTIENYSGDMFPNWLSGCALPNLISLKLQNCEGIKVFDNNSTNVPSKFLEVLKFDGMSEWEEWLCIEGFPQPQRMPSLQKLVIRGCKMLDVSIPNCDNIIQLDVQNCNRILINKLSSKLKRSVLGINQYVEFSVEHLINNPNREELQLDFKDFVECPSLGLCCYNSLWSLSITGWKSSSLPISLHLFTHLVDLLFEDCPELESFPMGFFPSNLIDLGLFNCPLVKEKYKKEGGESWHTISHIPNVEIDWIKQ